MDTRELVLKTLQQELQQELLLHYGPKYQISVITDMRYSPVVMHVSELNNYIGTITYDSIQCTFSCHTGTSSSYRDGMQLAQPNIMLLLLQLVLGTSRQISRSTLTQDKAGQ